MEPVSLLDTNNYRQAEESLFKTAEPTELGREEFLQLLVAQLENQDPFNPPEDTEFIAQLSTFSSLEQLVDLNKRIDAVLAGQSQLVNSQALDLIGREVLVDSSGEVSLSDAGKADEIIVELPETMSAAKVEIYGPGGLLRTIPLESSTQGQHRVLWDGLDDTGQPVDPGTYSFQATGTRIAGGSTRLNGYVVVPVEAVNVGSGGLSLVTGNRIIDFSRIVEIRQGQQQEDSVSSGAPGDPSSRSVSTGFRD